MNAAQSTALLSADPGLSRRWIEVVSHLDPKYGGLSAAVPALSAKLAAEGHYDVQLAAFCTKGEEFLPAGFTPQQLSYWPVSRKQWMNDGALRSRFEETLRDANGIHVHGLWEQSTAIAAKTARKLGIPYLISAHGMLEPWALANKRIKKMLYAALVERKNVQEATCLHALTRAEANHFVRFGATAPIAIIPNGVDIPKHKDPSLFFEQYPDARGKRLILFMARLHRKKGIEMLLDVWTTLSKLHPEALLVVAGPDADGMRAKLEHFCAEHSIAGHVLFTGMLKGEMKWTTYAAAECFVLPSFSEGLSVAVLEAMGMGLPVLITEPCNMPEVEEYRTGWETKADKKSLQSALEKVLRNSPATNAMIGRLGARLVATRYSWSTISAQFQDVYRWVQGGPVPSSVDVVVA